MEFTLRKLEELDIHINWGTITHEEVDALRDSDDTIVVSNISKLDTIEAGDHVYEFVYEGYIAELSAWITFKIYGSSEL